MHYEKAQYVDIFADFLLTIFSNIVFQASYEKYFIVKENTFDKVDLCINYTLRFKYVFYESFTIFAGLSKDLCFAIYFPG